MRDSVHNRSRVSWDTLSKFPEQKVLRKNSPRPSERKSRDVTVTKLNALKNKNGPFSVEVSHLVTRHLCEHSKYLI